MTEATFFDLYNWLGETLRLAIILVDFDETNLEFVVSPEIFNEIHKRYNDPNLSMKYMAFHKFGTRICFNGVVINQTDKFYSEPNQIPIILQKKR